MCRNKKDLIGHINDTFCGTATLFLRFCHSVLRSFWVYVCCQRIPSLPKILDSWKGTIIELFPREWQWIRSFRQKNIFSYLSSCLLSQIWRFRRIRSNVLRGLDLDLAYTKISGVVSQYILWSGSLWHPFRSSMLKNKRIFSLVMSEVIYAFSLMTGPGWFPEIAGNPRNHGNDQKFHKSHQILNQTKRSIKKLCLGKISLLETVRFRGFWVFEYALW